MKWICFPFVFCRVPRSKRDAVKEGSGEDDYEDYYEDEDDDTTKCVSFVFYFNF